ncbi:MAG: vanw family protein, partial [Oxalobacteraceae bacterium]
YVPGRELREGCLVPSVGGGLCQLSNALYETALRAGFEVVERHRHSQVIPGSLAEIDRDATVFWNYLDLRVRSDRPWRLEVKLDDSHLAVRILAQAAPQPHAVPLAPTPRSPLLSSQPGDCTTCDETDCHRHVGASPSRAHCAWLIDEPTPEFTAYRHAQWREGDRWIGDNGNAGLRMIFSALVARIRRRIALWRGCPIPLAKLEGLRTLAGRLAGRLRPSDTRLVVSQGVLPYLWRSGELGGRRFDVLMNALPMHEIQRRLNQAAARHPRTPGTGYRRIRKCLTLPVRAA